MATSTTKKQVAMHTDFFDRTKTANEHGFYLEAIFREYAAIEGRLEVLLGVLGAPCNKQLPFNQRKDIKISHRIECLSKYYKKANNIGNSKLDADYFKRLFDWVKDRNKYIHGLYKNEIEYQERCKQCKVMAENGLILSQMLYNEAKRLRRYLKNPSNNEISPQNICAAKNCLSQKQ